jgi:leucyl-tRNA synthetase
MIKYDHKEIEKKWQKYWEENDTNKTGEDNSKPKYYILDMFPYPSGAGLHVGHPKGYIATDIFARLKMMQGFNVLHPMGWDAFGLPAENYALKNKMHPRVCTEKNVETYRKQLYKFGFTYDWDREINTTDPGFYKWTQWAFIQMFKRGLAYESFEPIIWCPSCQTGLAMEDLEEGKCERCGSDVERKPMRQWVLKITAYADRMLNDLEKLPDWEESIKEMQRNWIGRSEGSTVKFEVRSKKLEEKNTPSPCEGEGVGEVLEVFTTRPDTLFGCTYMVVAPEHPIIIEHIPHITNQEEVKNYIENAKKKSDLERTELQKEKTGVRLEGVMAINPVNNEEIPVFVADYVLAGYGTGAIMAVPAHDERDFEFARKYNLSIKTVVTTDKTNVVGIGAMIETKDGKFLFQRRDNNTDRNPGMLAFFGGGIEGNESTIETLRREIKEEINIDIDENYILLNKLESYNFPGKWLDIFLVNGINEENIKLGEGEAIERLSLSEALKRDDVTLFTKNVIKYLLEKKCFTGVGKNINSGFLNGLETKESKEIMISWLEEKKIGKRAVNYKIKDWVFSRQRYWGEPIPIIHCEKCGNIAVPDEELPLKLPEVEHYEPTGTGESPLANISEWVNTSCPNCGGPAKRETNTMPQWAGSSWYYLRYIDPHNDKALIDKDKDEYWSPVDFYVGGAEHATRHLIYARFWHKFLFDIGAVNYDEPFTRLQHVGLILAEDGRKMSKRWGNVINPDDVIEQFGADTMRMYEMFMGPFSQPCAWSTSSMTGVRRFLERVWRLQSSVTSHQSPAKNQNLERLLHKTIKKISEDIEQFKLNTAVSAMMILLNEMEKEDELGIGNWELVIKMLAPFAPHIAEELWSSFAEAMEDKSNEKYSESIFKQSWPAYDPELIKDETVTVGIQINGKVRDEVEVGVEISEDEIKELVLTRERVLKWTQGREPKKVIYVKGKLVSVVI